LRHHPTLTSLERKLTDAERNLGRTLTTVEHTAERTVSEIAGLDNVDDPRPISSFLHEAAHLNFYRVHLLIFTFTPLIFSGIFYASNGPSPENQIAYVDALFMCTSAMAVTGLNSVLLASLTTWQQFIIFVRPFCLVPVSFLGRAFREREEVADLPGAPLCPPVPHLDRVDFIRFHHRHRYSKVRSPACKNGGLTAGD
jgi:hypothetical protein